MFCDWRCGGRKSGLGCLLGVLEGFRIVVSDEDGKIRKLGRRREGEKGRRICRAHGDLKRFCVSLKAVIMLLGLGRGPVAVH